MPELSYCIVLDPHVLGLADAGTAEMTANAKARARVILVNIVILLVWKPQWHVLDEVIVQRAEIIARCANGLFTFIE